MYSALNEKKKETCILTRMKRTLLAPEVYQLNILHLEYDICLNEDRLVHYIVGIQSANAKKW